ncbi:MAG: DUF4266 domain-containing protein [Calditrichaeota bacterium]|nr:DUF4266 domain-containing protein [Candidatus Cloacimonadota bacterium]MCB1048184.1 DUF4266 domain-containing protein [Calditrichota bacterium]
MSKPTTRAARPRSGQAHRILLLAPILALLGGCVFQKVQPWERDLLAEPEMQLVPDAQEQALDEHVYFSKEAPHGGEGVGGGGCGCN